jgi:hypothetical protein
MVVIEKLELLTHGKRPATLYVSPEVIERWHNSRGKFQNKKLFAMNFGVVDLLGALLAFGILYVNWILANIDVERIWWVKATAGGMCWG